MTKHALLVILLVGCAKTESDDILTSGIYAQISATALGDGTTTVSATLFVGNPINFNYVELAGDDQLIASHGTEDQVMVERELFNTVAHEATLQGDAEGDAFEVAFVRTIDAGAPRSVATLPAPFMLVSRPATVSRADALTVTWSPIGTSDAMSWRVEGDCIEREEGPITGDPGTVTIPANTIKPRAGQGTPTECAMTLSIARTRAGTLDPAYGKGGIISGTQRRLASITTTP